MASIIEVTPFGDATMVPNEVGEEASCLDVVFMAAPEPEEPQIDLADPGGYLPVPDSFDEVYEMSRTELVREYEDVFSKQVYDVMIVTAANVSESPRRNRVY